MQLVILYLATAIVFLALDAVALKSVLKPMFDKQLGSMLLDDIRMRPAIIFYLFYIAGVLWFVSVPALKAEMPLQALIGGAIIGALAYGTYEFTNFATLRDWTSQMVMVDLAWGTVLTGFSAWAGVMIARTFA